MPAGRKNLKSGYTLTETVVYAAIFVVLSVFVINSIIVSARGLREVRTARTTNTSAEAAMERMIREIRYSDSINAAQSTFGTSPGVLSLNSLDPSTGSSQTSIFSLSGNRLMLQKNAGTAYPLTSSSATITNLVFRNMVASSTGAVRVEMTINGKNFYGTAIMRRSY